MRLIVTQTQSQLNNLFHYFHVGVFQYYHQLADSKDNVMKEDGNAAISSLALSSLLCCFDFIPPNHQRGRCDGKLCGGFYLLNIYLLKINKSSSPVRTM